MTRQKVSHGTFYTTGGFSQAVLTEFAAETQPELVDGPGFLRRVEKLPPAARHRLFQFATAGDFTTPTCPSCGIKLVEREAARGKNAGTRFWGCANYPRCTAVIRPRKTAEAA